jgi:hypothetical protein
VTTFVDANGVTRYRCTCEFFGRSATDCRHLYWVLHDLGIMNLITETKCLQPVRKPGRPKKRPDYRERPTENVDPNPEPQQRRPSSYYIGLTVYSGKYHLGVVEGIDAYNRYTVVFPRGIGKPPVHALYTEEEIQLGVTAYERRNW